jgi:type II secretory pathway pseudopilin PulG
MPAFVSLAVAVISAIAAVATLLLYLHSIRRSDQDSAREEALALAETRGEMIQVLRRRTRELEAALAGVRCCLEERPPDVAGALARIRESLPTLPRPRGSEIVSSRRKRAGGRR